MPHCTDALVTTGTDRYVVKFKNIDVTGAAANELVAAVTGKKIRVLSLFITADTTGTFNFQDDTGTPVTLCGGTRQIKLSSDGTAGGYSFTLPYNPCGWFQTSAGQALDINMASGTFAGCLSYIEV